MQAYHRNIRYPTHLLLTYQWYSPNWWLVEDQNYTCTGEQRGEVLHMTLSVNIFVPSRLDEGFSNTSMNIVSGCTICLAGQTLLRKNWERVRSNGSFALRMHDVMFIYYCKHGAHWKGWRKFSLHKLSSCSRVTCAIGKTKVREILWESWSTCTSYPQIFSWVILYMYTIIIMTKNNVSKDTCIITDMHCHHQTEEEFLHESKNHANKPPFNFSSGGFYYCHDATWALAWSLNKAITCKICHWA